MLGTLGIQTVFSESSGTVFCLGTLPYSVFRIQFNDLILFRIKCDDMTMFHVKLYDLLLFHFMQSSDTVQ